MMVGGPEAGGGSVPGGSGGGGGDTQYVKFEVGTAFVPIRYATWLPCTMRISDHHNQLHQLIACDFLHVGPCCVCGKPDANGLRSFQKGTAEAAAER